MLVDTHCHLNSLSSDQRRAVLARAGKELLCFDSSIDIDSSRKSLSLSSETDQVFSCLGFHPYSLDQFSPDTIDIYRSWIKEHKRIAAIGEIGLDCKAPFSLDRQAEVFRQFIEMALAQNLPLVLHNRLDSQMILDVLDEYYDDYQKIMFHCFSQDEAFADRVLAKNGMFSFSLNVLRKNAQSRRLLAYVPEENMVLETDSPYMRIKGDNSTPLDVEKVYLFTAETKNIPLPELKQKILENAGKVFKI